MKKIIVLLLVSISTLLASIGEITALRGEATLLRAGGSSALSVGSTLEEKDEIQTASKSKLQIKFKDDTVISLGQKSHLKVDEYLFGKKKVAAKFSISKGFFKSITGKIGKVNPKKFKIKTANATIGIRGTTVIADVSDKRDIIACSEGQILVTNPQGSMIVNAGERTIVKEMKMPKQSQKVNSIVLKQLDIKSNPAVTERVSPEVVMQHESSTENESLVKEEVVDDEKKSEKFDPWVESDSVQNLESIRQTIGTNNPTYSGKIVEGKTEHGAIDKDSSSVNLRFDLGSGAMDGDLKFSDQTTQHNIDVEGSINNNGSFDFNSANGYDGGGDGALSGDKFEHANGGFKFTETDVNNPDEIKVIEGKFETTIK